MSEDPLLIDRADGVLTLTLNRADALNSLNIAMKLALLEALEAAAVDPACRAIVLTGAGRAFCAGQDLKEHTEALATSDSPLDTVTRHLNPLARALVTMPKPVIAAVVGTAAGAGASLAFLADLRIGGPRTSFLMAFANVGLAADTGASWSLPRLVGYAKATEMLLLAEPVRADEAHRIGLLTQLLAEDAEVLPTAQALARRLAAGPTFAYGLIKHQLVTSTSFDTALDVEAETQHRAGATADHRSATAAFVAKEKPTYTGT